MILNHTLKSTTFLIFALVCCGISAGMAAEVDIQAKYLEYDETNKYAIATDSVTVTWGDRTLRADKVEFWIEKEFLRAQGNVALTEANNVMRGSAITYDYRAEKGEIDNASGTFDPWIFKADRLQKTGDKKYSSGRMDLTSCDLSKPHYIIRASRAKITLNRRATVYNPVFVVGGVPVFWLPIWSQGLGRSARYSLEVQPGYNDTDGFILKTIFGYPVTEHSYGKLYLDYYSIRGVGTGAEYNYSDGDKSRGSIYGYHMAENNTGNEYYSLRAEHWQRINHLWTARADINYLNNISFNNNYFLDNYFIVNNALTSNLSFTRQDSVSNLLVNFGRTDQYDPNTGGFEPQTITVPSISYTRYSVIRTLPFSNTLSATLSNDYSDFVGDYTQRGTINASVSKGFSFLRRRMTLTPSLSVAENWNDQSDRFLFPDIDTFRTRYISAMNLRYRLSSYFSWDVGYNAGIRSAINSLAPEDNANDYGIETSRVYFQNYFSMGRVSVRNATGYDLRTIRGDTRTDWREKLSPLVNEMTWLPGNFVTLFFREENIIYPAKLTSLQALVSAGRPDERYGSIGLFYNGYAPDNLAFTVGFGFWPTSKWKLDYNLSAEALDRFSGLRLGEQQIRLYRDLHCWEFKIAYRRRPLAEEINFQINLKVSSANRARLYNKSQEQEYYPWRN